MDPNDLQKIITLAGTSSEKTQQAQKQVSSIKKLISQMTHITNYLQHLEQGVVAISQEIEAQGLGMQMMLKIMTDKKLCTEEEASQYYQEHVYAPMKKNAEELQAKMQAAIKETQEQIEKAKDTDEESNIVRLPNGK